MPLYQRNPSVVLRPIHGASFLINITDNYQNDTCAIHEINETGAFLWQHLNEPKSVDELAQILSDAIIDDVDLSVIRDDTAEFFSSLLALGFVEVRKDD